MFDERRGSDLVVDRTAAHVTSSIAAIVTDTVTSGRGE